MSEFQFQIQPSPGPGLPATWGFPGNYYCSGDMSVLGAFTMLGETNLAGQAITIGGPGATVAIAAGTGANFVNLGGAGTTIVHLKSGATLDLDNGSNVIPGAGSSWNGTANAVPHAQISGFNTLSGAGALTITDGRITSTSVIAATYTGGSGNVIPLRAVVPSAGTATINGDNSAAIQYVIFIT